MWTDQIVDTGVVIRVYFHTCLQFDDGHKEWHFYGTDPDSVTLVGPNADEPVFEHTYVQFPGAWSDLPPDEYNSQIYGIALASGLNREGLYG
jgi:hypothetical protein